jgi:hypothetical protein
LANFYDANVARAPEFLALAAKIPGDLSQMKNALFNVFQHKEFEIRY